MANAGAAGDFATPSKNPAVCGLIGVLFAASASFMFFVFVPFVTHTNKLPDGGYTCDSTETSFPLVNSEGKGMNIDDTTIESCFERALTTWPNTNGEKIKYFRMFKAWDKAWPSLQREDMWNNLQSLLDSNDARLLLGTSVSCDIDNDKQSWEWAKQLMSKLGADRILGVAVGNEMELLYSKTEVPHIKECTEMVWQKPNDRFKVPDMGDAQEGYFSWVFKHYLQDIRTLGDDFAKIKFTTVMGGAVLGTDGSSNCKSGTCYLKNIPSQALFDDWMHTISDYLRNDMRVSPSEHYVWTLNDYPFWEPSNQMDADNVHCTTSENSALDLSGGTFKNPVTAIRARFAPFGFNQNSDPLWIGETGWSSPVPDVFETPVQQCKASQDGWGSLLMFKQYYQEFLKWDLGVSGANPLDKVFYFGMRDSVNFNLREGFGLVATCDNPRCKIQADTPSFLNHGDSSDATAGPDDHFSATV